MSAYLLTRSETWALATLLHLPIQPGSVLSDWLSLGDEPESADQASASSNLDTLAQKKYYFPTNNEHPLHPMLLSSLALASVNAATITLMIRRAGQASMTRFAQAGKGLLQYGMDVEHLYLHPVVGQAALEQDGKIIPSWFAVSQDERLQAELSPGAFVLFKQACELADLSAAESNFASRKFAKSKLLEQGKILDGWTDVFNVTGTGAAAAPGQRHLDDDYRLLIFNGFLQENAAGTIEIGSIGKALAASFSDPDLCSLIVSLQIWEGGFPKTGVFLYGGERLFFLDVSQKPGVFVIRQLANRQEAYAWVSGLLADGSRARYTDYVIAPIK